MFPSASPRGTLRVEGKQNSLFSEGLVINCSVIHPDSKIEHTEKKNLLEALVQWLHSHNERLSKIVFFFAANKK